MTSDTWVLRTVTAGYQLEFTSPPPAFSRPLTTTIPTDKEKRLALRREIQELLKKQAIEIVPPSKVAFHSTFFLTPKKNGEWRPILNLKRLNKFIQPPPFKTESLAAVLPELRNNWWAVTLDLKDAYLHVAIHHSSRRWLGFAYDNQTYRFKCLPFGLSTAPRTFTRVVKVIAEHFRKQGMFIFADLDDWLLTAPSSPEILKSQLSRVLETVQNLSFIVNFKKSSLVPSQRLQFLGAILDFRRGMVFPSEERVSDTVDTASRLLQIESPPAGLWMRMLGLIASMEFILPLCLMRMRVIQLHALDNFNNQNSQSLMDYIIFSLCSFTNPFASSFATLK